MTGETLLRAITDTYTRRGESIRCMSRSPLHNAIQTIVELIEECAAE